MDSVPSRDCELAFCYEADCNPSCLAPKHFSRSPEAILWLCVSPSTFRAEPAMRNDDGAPCLLRIDLCRGHLLVVCGSRCYNGPRYDVPLAERYLPGDIFLSPSLLSKALYTDPLLMEYGRTPVLGSCRTGRHEVE